MFEMKLDKYLFALVNKMCLKMVRKGDMGLFSMGRADNEYTITVDEKYENRLRGELLKKEIYEYKIVAINETKYWHGDIVKEAGQIWGVYLVCVSIHTHICSFTASQWYEHIANITTRQVNDKVDDEIRATERSSTYYQAGDVKGLTIWYKPDEDEDAVCPENLIESLVCNYYWELELAELFGIEFEDLH